MLFLPATAVTQSSGRLAVNVVNKIWNHLAGIANVEGMTPHLARHAMGRHLIEKTGNIFAVQRQLGHKNAVYSMQYTRITERELAEVMKIGKLGMRYIRMLWAETAIYKIVSRLL